MSNKSSLGWLDPMVVVHDDGVPLPTRGALNFIGAAVTDNPSAGTIDIQVTSGAPTSGLAASTITAGDVICSANLADQTKVVRATPAALLVAGTVLGVALSSVTSGQQASYAGAGDVLAAAGLPLGAGVASWVVVDASAHLVRKAIPTGADYVVGKCDTLGNPTIQPGKFDGVQVANVRTFGAKGDGSTDDTAAFAAAVAALPVAGGAVYVPAGVFRLASTQTITAHIDFGADASITVDATHTVTIHGQVTGHEYQQLFEGAGKVIVRDAGTLSTGWFGSLRDGTLGASCDAIKRAIAAADTGISTGQGQLSRKIVLPGGKYNLEKPIVITSGNIELTGDAMLGTMITATSYAGPGIVISNQGTLTQHLADYGSLASCTIGHDDFKRVVLSNYGEAWNIDGKSALCLDMIVKISGTQTGTSVILCSGGKGPDESVEDCAIAIYAGALDFSYSNTDLGIRFDVTTVNGLVSAYTASGVIDTTSNAWYHIRCDYDGAHLRIFINGVAQTLRVTGTTSIAQTGVVVQKHTEGVTLGQGLNGGFNGWAIIIGVPIGLRMACLSLAHASRGSGNFTPPVGKYPEDATTKFLMDFDVVDPAGGLVFARSYSHIFGMQDAWLANTGEGDNTQIGNVIISNMYMEIFNGPGVDSVATPDCIYEKLYILGQSGLLMHSNAYFSNVKDCRFISAGGHGVGIYLGSASNYVELSNIYCNSFTVNLHSIATFNASGGNYWINAQYSNIYLDQCFLVEMSGSNFSSDEGSPNHIVYGVIIKGCGVGRFSGFLFGLQTYADQYQVLITNDGRTISPDGTSRVKIEHCQFTANNILVNAIKVQTTLDVDSIVVDDCSRAGGSLNYFTLAADSFARITVLPDEYAREKSIALTGSTADVDINDWCFGRIKLTGAGSSGYTLMVPPIPGYGRVVHNATSDTIVVTTTTGGSTGPTIAAGKRAQVYCDGTNVYRETADL